MASNPQFRERGSATLVEFAFVLPVLMVLVFGIIEFSAAAYAFHFVSNAAREGSRFASVRGSGCPGTFTTACPAAQDDVSTYVQGIVPTGISAAAITTTASWPGTDGAGNSGTTSKCDPGDTKSAGCVVTVQVQYVYTLSFPMVTSIPLNISSTSQMVISQ